MNYIILIIVVNKYCLNKRKMKQYKIRLNKKSINQYTSVCVHNKHTLPKLVSPLFGKILSNVRPESQTGMVPASF